MSVFEAFGEMERAGWSNAARAGAYVDMFATVSDQAIPSLVSSVEAAPQTRVLDLCCGQGNVSEALAVLGCEVVGADFSSAMLSLAEQRVPQATFIEADAQDLPFEDGEFDAVVSNLGICALSEAYRVLKPGGSFGMTVWCGPDSSPAFAVFYGAVQAHGDPEVSIPEGSDFHQFAKSEIAERLLVNAGFTGINTSVIDCFLELAAPNGLLEIYENATVRAAALLRGQPKENLEAIRTKMEANVRESYPHGDG